MAANLAEIWESAWGRAQEFVSFSKQPLLKNKEMVGESFAYSYNGGLVAKLCRTLGDPLVCSPPGSSVYGIFQARISE